jgi:uncharacterized membrane protein
MEQVPDFWRTEVFHPLSVHFPIALLLMAFVFKLIALKYKREVWELGGTILLITGVIAIWVAVYTGDLADGIVSRKICDPTILKDHQNMAYTTAWIFSVSAALDSLKFLKNTLIMSKQWLLKMVIVLLMIAGSAVLVYVGHLGASLVYQQAAGVYQPSGNCAEFN